MSGKFMPLLYQAHHQQDVEDIHFWQIMAKEYGGPILELGCGTGRVLIPLAQTGYRVFGLDLDSQMLGFLQSRIPNELNQRVSLIRADFRHSCLSNRFPLIMMPCNTYSTIKISDRLLVLNRARVHLSVGGVFIVSMPNPSTLQSLPMKGETDVETWFPHPQTGDNVQVSSAWMRSGKEVSFSWHYDHLLSDGRVNRYSLSTKHEIQDVAAILDEFGKAGFKGVTMYGDYDQSEYCEESPYLILVGNP